MKIKWHIQQRSGEFEIDDDLREEEISQLVTEEASQWLEWEAVEEGNQE